MEDSRSNIIRSKLLSPLFIILPHELRLWQIKLARPEEPEQCLVVESIIAQFGGALLSFLLGRGCQACLFEVGAELSEGRGLGFVPVPHPVSVDPTLICNTQEGTKTYRWPGWPERKSRVWNPSAKSLSQTREILRNGERG